MGSSILVFHQACRGTYLGSSGCEIWRYDGTTWEPVISDIKDVDEAGTITGISSCAANDGSTTATITDSTQSWTTNQWAGGVLQITSGSGKYRKFRIISNTANTLTIQQNESCRYLQQLRAGDRVYQLCQQDLQ